MGKLERATETRLDHAINQVKVYSDIDLSVHAKAKSLHKFGMSTTVDSSKFHDLWPLSDSGGPYRPATNLLVSIASSNTNDTEDIYIEGHTISGTDLSFVSQTITLTGQTEATLATPLARCTRMVNRGTSNLVGNIYVWDGSADTTGTPNDLTKVGGHIVATEQQTQQAFTSLSASDYFFITEVVASVNRAQSAAVDIDMDTRDVSTGGVWLPAHVELALHTTGATTVQASLDPVHIIAANHDIRMRARGSSATDTTVSGYFAGYLASIV